MGSDGEALPRPRPWPCRATAGGDADAGAGRSWVVVRHRPRSDLVHDPRSRAWDATVLAPTAAMTMASLYPHPNLSIAAAAVDCWSTSAAADCWSMSAAAADYWPAAVEAELWRSLRLRPWLPAFFLKPKIRFCGAWYIVRHKSPTLSVAHVLSAPQNKNLVATILWRTHHAPQNSKLVRH